FPAAGASWSTTSSPGSTRACWGGSSIFSGRGHESCGVTSFASPTAYHLGAAGHPPSPRQVGRGRGWGGTQMTVELLTFTPDPGAGGGGAEGAAAGALARLFERHGIAVRGRGWVSPDEGEVDRALRHAVEAGGLVACLGDGEGADVARQALARLLGARLVLSDGALDALARAYARQGRAMPR